MLEMLRNDLVQIDKLSSRWWHDDIDFDDIDIKSEESSSKSGSTGKILPRCNLAINPMFVRSWWIRKVIEASATAALIPLLVSLVQEENEEEQDNADEPEPLKWDNSKNIDDSQTFKVPQQVPEVTKDIESPFDQWAKQVEIKARENVARGVFRKPLYCTNGWKQLRMKTSGNLPPPPVRLDLLSSPAINLESDRKHLTRESQLFLRVRNRNIEWRSSPSPLKAAAEMATLLLSGHRNYGGMTPTPPSVSMSSLPYRCRKRPSTAPTSRAMSDYVPPTAVCLDCKQPLFMTVVCCLCLFLASISEFNQNSFVARQNGGTFRCRGPYQPLQATISYLFLIHLHLCSFCHVFSP